MKFSLVIPLAPGRDAEILNSIRKLDYPKSEIQVIVVKSTNASDNRNKGAKRAKGEIIGFLDDDATLDKDFLKNVDEFFSVHHQIDVAGGPQLTPKDEKGFAKLSGFALCSRFGAADASSRYSRGKLNLNADEKSLTSANLFVRKPVMERVQFDTTLWPGEDPKFIADCKKEGFKVAYSPDFYLYHRRRADVKSLVKQIFNYGKVRPAKESIFETMKMPVFFVPSMFLVYLVALIIGIFIWPIYWSLMIIPLGFYLALDVLFSIYESLKNKSFNGIFVLPFVFLLIHLSYGAGMIWGYIRKLLGKTNHVSKL